MTSSRRKDERVHKNAIFNRLTAGVSSAFKRLLCNAASGVGPRLSTEDFSASSHMRKTACLAGWAFA